MCASCDDVERFEEDNDEFNDILDEEYRDYQSGSRSDNFVLFNDVFKSNGE